MATFVVVLGTAQNATLSLTADDVAQEVVSLRVDARSALRAVKLTIYSADGTTERVNEVFQPGTDTTRNLVGQTRFPYSFAARLDGHKTSRQVFIPPPFSFAGA